MEINTKTVITFYGQVRKVCQVHKTKGRKTWLAQAPKGKKDKCTYFFPFLLPQQQQQRVWTKTPDQVFQTTTWLHSTPPTTNPKIEHAGNAIAGKEKERKKNLSAIIILNQRGGGGASSITAFPTSQPQHRSHSPCYPHSYNTPLPDNYNSSSSRN